MSQIDIPEHEQKRQESLERLYDLRDELETVANSDTKYAQYAQNGLERLQEAGYDV